jgi:hypothetical protein
LTEATSNVGVCASSDAPDNMMAMLNDFNKLFDTAIYLAVRALSDIGAQKRNLAVVAALIDARATPIRAATVRERLPGRSTSSPFA